jgi:hypothetical protein
MIIGFKIMNENKYKYKTVLKKPHHFKFLNILNILNNDINIFTRVKMNFESFPTYEPDLYRRYL